MYRAHLYPQMEYLKLRLNKNNDHITADSKLNASSSVFPLQSGSNIDGMLTSLDLSEQSIQY